MASLFDTLQANAFRAGVQARTRQSSKWFQSKIEDMTMPSRQKLLKDPALEQTDRVLGIEADAPVAEAPVMDSVEATAQPFADAPSPAPTEEKEEEDTLSYFAKLAQD